MSRIANRAGTASEAQRSITIVVPEAGRVSGLIERPESARFALVLAHGAGAGMRHAFMTAIAARLAARGVATLRYQFPYMEAGGGPPDPPSRLVATVRAAVDAGREHLVGLPLFAGGKSLGGRMTSTAAAEGLLPEARGLLFLGFPLHPPGRPGTTRAAHLARVSQPMLFLQGTRDTLADLELLRPVCGDLGARALLHVVEGADHSFHVLKRSGRGDEAVLDELADRGLEWMQAITGAARA
jgi:predicted alpha/beta-hydrolase family hydrolase